MPRPTSLWWAQCKAPKPPHRAWSTRPHNPHTQSPSLLPTALTTHTHVCTQATGLAPRMLSSLCDPSYLGPRRIATALREQGPAIPCVGG